MKPIENRQSNANRRIDRKTDSMHGRKDGWMAIEFAQAGNNLPAPQRIFFPSSIIHFKLTLY